MQRRKRWLVLVPVVVVTALLTISLGLTWRNHERYASRKFDTAGQVPADPGEQRIAIVFGAGVWRGGEPSPVLYDRLSTAADLYHEGKASKLLLTGDNRALNHNEPAAMRQAVLVMGVPEKDLVLDYAGRRTYDSCYRARSIFGVERAVLVTQAFHLDRALYTCNSLGVDSIGLAAGNQAYGGENLEWLSLRELGATLGAWFDLHVLHPVPVMGEKLPIDSTSPSSDQN